MATDLHKTSSDYINELKFDYIETYSFQRGPTYDAYLKEYFELLNKQEKKKLSPEQEISFLALINQGLTQSLIYDSGKLHPSAKIIRTFKEREPEIERLTTILQTEVTDVPMWMCAPAYRDAVIFYDNSGNIISTLNICFSCDYMARSSFLDIHADVKTYALLKQFFVELGHEIET
jgi:hypothetical protein